MRFASAFALVIHASPAYAADRVAPAVFAAKLFGKIPGHGLTGDDTEHGISLVRGADDRLFKLDRTQIHACLPIVQDEDIKASIRTTR